MPMKRSTRLKHRCLDAVFILLIVALPACAVLPGGFRAVDEGRLYRSGQLHSEGLERRLEQHSIRTVVSLRAPEPEKPWFREEVRVCREKGVARYDLVWSKDALPPPESLARLVELFQTAEGPILVHCEGGVHRTGVASAVYLLTRGATVEEARKELGPWFHDAPIGRLIDLYVGSDLPFEQWVHEEYPPKFTEHMRGHEPFLPEADSPP